MSRPLPATVGVVGLGRFGRLWASMLQGDFTLSAYDSDPGQRAEAERAGLTPASLRETLAADAVFYCVPISAFERTLTEHLPLFEELGGTRTLIDVLSVKLHPREVFDRHLPATYQALLTHPLFGPDSVAASGLEGQTIVVDGFRMTPVALDAWKAYFTSKGLVVVPMSADAHDRLAAQSQGVTHFVGRTLERFGFAQTPIDTLGTRRLHDVTSQVSNDTWQLFVDLQTLNPHTRAMRLRMSEAQELGVRPVAPQPCGARPRGRRHPGRTRQLQRGCRPVLHEPDAGGASRDRVSAHHRTGAARAARRRD